MKFQTVLAAIFAFVAVSSKKGLPCGFGRYCGQNPTQIANLNNRANSNGSALAINSAFVGDANACVQSGATNANYVSQNQNQGGCF